MKNPHETFVAARARRSSALSAADSECRDLRKQHANNSLLWAWPLASVSPAQEGLFYGILVSVAMAVGSFFTLRWAISRSYGTFLNVLFGGMVARLVIIGGVMVWAWRFSTIDAFVFTITVLVSYIFFQIVEVFVAQKQIRSARLVRPAGKQV